MPCRLLALGAVPLLTLAAPAQADEIARADDTDAQVPAADTPSEAGGRPPLFEGGKLLLTNGISTLEGASGGGIAKWATISGMEMEGGIGFSGHVAAVELPDFGLRTYGVSLGISDRVEISYARQDFDTRAAGEALGLGRGFTLNQDVFAAKVRLLGDVVYGAPALPQVAVGVEYKRNLDAPVVAALEASGRDGVDVTLSATKLLLGHSLLVSATARLTEANQLGLTGFGGPDRGASVQFEGSLAYQLSRRAVIGAEVRTKPDNLGLGEDDWFDVFAAYAITDTITLTAAYVDLGSIATFEDQRGGFLQAQFAF
ncbi:MAG: DUF3034 family protein [Erythrobacter sp.]|jgi:hypothetical protein|nr:DUF3034 family protein [Erythrobacter sp.]